MGYLKIYLFRYMDKGGVGEGRKKDREKKIWRKGKKTFRTCYNSSHLTASPYPTPPC